MPKVRRWRSSWAVGTSTSSNFQDQRFDDFGISLASPASTGIPLNHTGNWGIYGVADASLYQTEDGGLSAFARIGGSPGDRNLISFYVDGGLTYKGLIPGRGGDTAGIAVGYSRIGGNARGLDQDVQVFGNPGFPVRNQEVVLELSYQFQLTPWMTLAARPSAHLSSGWECAEPGRLDPPRRIGVGTAFGADVLTCLRSAVHVDRRTGDERRSVARQEIHHRGDFVRFAGATERAGLRAILRRLWRARAHRRIDQAWSDCIDPDAVPAEPRAEALGQIDDRRLGGAVSTTVLPRCPADDAVLTIAPG